MKNILAFDTSSSVLSIALKRGEDTISETKITGFFHHAENLLPKIDQMLKKKKLTINDIRLFLIGRGPGSFTGLRIGFATLKGFLALKKKPCWGALSLDMIAENLNLPENSRLAVCLDAHRKRIYVRFYKRKKGEWKPEAKPQALEFSEIAEKISKETYLAGNALERYGDDFKKLNIQKKIHFTAEKDWYPKASTLIRWHEEKNKKLSELKTPVDFSPLYFRLSEPEEKRKEHVFAC